METAIANTINGLRSVYKTFKTHPKEWRESQLKGLKKMIKHENDNLLDAVHKDLGKCKQEFYTGEISVVQTEIDECLSHLSTWMKPTAVSTPLYQMKGLSTSQVQPTPLGVVLIIAPWNYPINLVLAPLVGALAAGNCVVIKPSELAPATATLLSKLLPKYLDNECVKVIEGGVAETTEILKHPFDHIFYTGNPTVGKIIMKAAAEHLTPVTLELGGKNPTFIDSSADIHVAAKRIAWGKFYNCGQTCLAPDYILVKKDIEEKFINEMIKEVKAFYGDNPKESPDYARIIAPRHAQRLASYLDDVDSKNVVIGGKETIDTEGKYVPPTIIRNVTPNMKVMSDEIFGPILPIITIDSWDEAIEFVNARPHPLALYIFAGDSNLKQKILKHTQSGGAVCNDVVVHFAQTSLPFGGVGMSGMGAYHGKKSFDTFSHQRAILDKTVWFDMSLRYPPYTDQKLAQTKMFI